MDRIIQKISGADVHTGRRGDRAIAGRVLLLFCIGALWPAQAVAQRLARATDSIRVNTIGGTFSGVAVAVDAAHLLLRAQTDPGILQMDLRSSDIQRLEVYAGPRSRARGALLGAAAGAVLPVLFIAVGATRDYPAIGPTRKQALQVMIAVPIVATALGYAMPGKRWHAAELPAAGTGSR